MLNELVSMLEMTLCEVKELRDSPTRTLATGHDARAHIGYVNTTVEVLDALGWRAAIQTDADLDKIAPQAAEKRREFEQEDESR